VTTLASRPDHSGRAQDALNLSREYTVKLKPLIKWHNNVSPCRRHSHVSRSALLSLSYEKYAYKRCHCVFVSMRQSIFDVLFDSNSIDVNFNLSDRTCLYFQCSKSFSIRGNCNPGSRVATFQARLQKCTRMATFSVLSSPKKACLASHTPNAARDDSQPPHSVSTSSADHLDSRSRQL
jgi:hypothetical protein